MVEILVSQSPEDCSREIFTDFHISLLIRSETCLFLSKGMRLRFQKYTQMCLFWNSVAAPDTLYTRAQACRLLFSSSQLMPASLFSCTDTRQNNLITRLCFICYTVHNFCCFLPAWYSQNTFRHRYYSGRLEQIYELELLWPAP